MIIGKCIGSGAEAEVFEGTYDGHDVVIKQIKMPINLHNKREIHSLKSLMHENIVKLIDVTIKNNFCCLVLDKWDTTLWDIITEKLDISVIRHILKQVLTALAYIHSNKYIHRDIKPSNILIKKNGIRVAVSDFGLVTKRSSGDQTPQMVTLCYRSPEILLGEKKYSYATDMWSVGCVFLEMLLHKGVPLFYDANESEIAVLHMIKKFNIKKYKNIDTQAFDLVQKMLCDKSTRISAESALQHAFFSHHQ